MCTTDVFGILAKDVCCPTSCGSCGGVNCSTRNGGDDFTGGEACCGSGVRSLDRICSATVGAPCVVAAGKSVCEYVRVNRRGLFCLGGRVTHNGGSSCLLASLVMSTIYYILALFRSCVSNPRCLIVAFVGQHRVGPTRTFGLGKSMLFVLSGEALTLHCCVGGGGLRFWL